MQPRFGPTSCLAFASGMGPRRCAAPSKLMAADWYSASMSRSCCSAAGDTAPTRDDTAAARACRGGGTVRERQPGASHGAQQHGKPTGGS